MVVEWVVTGESSTYLELPWDVSASYATFGMLYLAYIQSGYW